MKTTSLLATVVFVGAWLSFFPYDVNATVVYDWIGTSGNPIYGTFSIPDSVYLAARRGLTTITTNDLVSAQFTDGNVVNPFNANGATNILYSIDRNGELNVISGSLNSEYSFSYMSEIDPITGYYSSGYETSYAWLYFNAPGYQGVFHDIYIEWFSTWGMTDGPISRSREWSGIDFSDGYWQLSGAAPNIAPEPSTFLLFGAGIGGLAYWRRAKGKSA